MKRWTKVAVSAVAAALTVSGCAGSGGNSGQGGSKELVVWLMSGSAPTAMTDELHKEFEAAHPGVKVKYEIQQWTGIQDKLNTALAGTTPPDVLEIGNTQSPKFAEQKVLTDLTANSADLGGANWGAGLKASGTWEGKQFAVPFYAANRLVLFRKDLFEKAGITSPPSSQAEWLSAIEKLKASNKDDPEFQPLYLAGQNWYTLLSFIWDEGGDVAKQDGTKFTATLNTPEAKAGLEFYKKLVDLSGTKAPKDADEEKPPQAGVFGKGKVGMIVGLPWEVATAAKENPEIKNLTSGFAIPGKKAGSTAPVFQGGSNLAVPAGSKNADLAKDYLKLLATEKYQQLLVGAGMIPGSSKNTSALDKDPVSAAMAKGALSGKAVPASPNWGSVEAGANPIKTMLTAYLTGVKSLDQATSDANTAIQQALAGK
ncbi:MULTISPECIES: extracellular solute-binding protein [unclassified Crossiella]|uniref:extracellular solute-binding protein n=1 Tax=unclassified Crossiella TaxID=2620835 RepID=UPI001FFF93DE|nr:MULTISPECIES: extracellular solute-binding protein [unclassified Crossiella]MCK2237889.1 extracellular solute-binding protein [Crossiella sp. S99.2]MCK2255175.1 extracellular solute-binding protein [Crossiella sp. S99.1]